jgi:hypothetical protein
VADGKGIAAALDRIRQAFREVHGDVRDKTQVHADRQLHVEIANDEQKVEVRKTESAEKVRARTARLADALVQSALRSPNVYHNPSQRESNGCYELEVPSESPEELFKQALHDLER